MKLNARRVPAVMALISSALALVLAGCSKEAPAPTPERAVRTLLISETGGVLEREYSADIRARTESRLGFRVPGKVARRLVELGQSVRSGQVLGQLDPQDLRLQQDAARAGLAAAEANATQATSDLKRFTELKSQGFISEAELERHTTMARTAEANLRQARAQAGVQSNQTSYAALVADAAGVITSVDMEPGQVVNAGMPVLTLAHDGARDAVFAVPEDLGQVVRGLVGKKDAIKVRRWGTSEWVPATVREVAAAADPVTRTFQAKADVGKAGFELGQSASVAFNTPARVSGGLRIPLYALAERDGKSIVWVLDDKTMTVKPQPVITGDITGNVVLVAKGLNAGQEIVTAGVHALNPGQKVRRYRAGAADAAASGNSPAVKP
ncbi:MAG TPA: efflux RND transporter periplasmic adaptor subunit [Aquabacterium sp.]|uniref:efflux RND transporter periplasmic adaptor subunit n=1 Tax=Aquabacterium sp. TaxID=1872578 RepID=UPI002E2FFC57|nr:efflux RND transporter periplasmic adaptor subunit [Aquabacterium sp.]HEX5357691.1 efflux RND transporter periplasmic adaptor subunit [Aquabacterium sp.]